MGTPVPPDFPELIDEKWYCLTVEYYEFTEPDEGCDGPYSDTDKCCRKGKFIKAWYEGGWSCKAGFGVCIPLEAQPQRVVACHGPYDSGEECAAECFP